ncbi:CapA family protein [Neobacillus sp. LXY-4]|uniref:CapA family protein n=1 Tax=Neobacillus sp. LXY-4 TaxID=3379826 RepID=UPI003EE2A68E
MKNTVKIFISLAIAIIVFITYFFLQGKELANKNKEQVEVALHSARNTTASAKEMQQTATIGAIGDILIHDWVYEDAKTESTYDFKPMLSNIKGAMQKPDFLIANQETILGGVQMGLSSYPTFNSPQEVGDAFIDAGVDFVSTANNHSLDKGERGILAEIDYFNRVGLPYVGAFKDEKDQQTLRIMNVNGIKIAILSYTYGTNGIPIPEGKNYLVNLIDKEKMKEEINRAKQAADLVIMSMHWGNEYQRTPSPLQKELAQYLVNEGADIIIGHHPHVLQPMEWLTDESGQKAFVIYSLGNFLSGQMYDYKDIGGLVTIDIKKSILQSGVTIELSNPTFMPTYVSNQKLKNYRVVPLKEAEDYGLPNASAKNDEIMNHMTQWLHE